MEDEDRMYFQRRVEDELRLAQGSADANVVRAHYEFLEHYLDRLYPADEGAAAAAEQSAAG